MPVLASVSSRLVEQAYRLLGRALFAFLSAAWWHKRKFGLAALLLYTCMAAAVMAPLASEQVPATPAEDLCNHISGIIEARCALGEGQFPIRVAPHQNFDTRYPIFQFYGNLPYTLGGVVYRATHANPYAIWKLEVTAFLVLGAFFTYRCARVLTRQALAALAAGAVFLTAPYVLTDIHGRYAFSEIIAFMLLPVVFYFSWRSFVTRPLGPILAAAVAWSALALSHNVAYLYGATYFGLFFLSWLVRKGDRPLLPERPGGYFAQKASVPFWHPWRGKQLFRCCRVGAGFALGLILTAWSIVPQQLLVRELGSALTVNVMSTNWLTPLGVLLAPGVALPVHVPTIYINEQEHFGLQIGWPILAAVGLSLCCLRGPFSRLPGRRALMGRFLVLFALAFFMVWTPFDFWQFLPKLFSYVQFSYRLLMFAVLWGSLLTAFALAAALEGRIRAIHLAAIVLVLGWTASPYVRPHKADPTVTVARELAKPEMGRGGATMCYLMSGERLAETTLLHSAMNWADSFNGGVLDYTEFSRAGRLHAVMPDPLEGDMLLFEGAISPDVKTSLKLKICIDGIVIAAPELPPGPFELAIPMPAAPIKDRVYVTIEGKPLVTPPPPPHAAALVRPSYEPKLLALRPGPGRPKEPQLILAGDLREWVRFRHPTTLRFSTQEPALVQMPVLYYPGMQQVTLDGNQVDTQHLGRFVALEVPPGEHELSVRFVGVPWADRVSLAGWVGVIGAALVLGLRRLVEKLHDKRGAPDAVVVSFARVTIELATRTVRGTATVSAVK